MPGRLAVWTAALALVMLAAACTQRGPVSVDTSTTTTPAVTTTTAVTPRPTPPPPVTTPTSGPSPPTGSTGPLSDLPLRLELVAEGFAQPVFLGHPPSDRRRFVVDQPGRIWLMGDADPELFLDITDRVVFGGERGLLSMAFHPGSAENDLFYVNYTDRSGATVVSEFRAGSSRADPATERILLRIEQPAGNHNGGMIAFGPDGNLWIGMGDGGASDDRFGNGQNPDTLLGAMLRITVGPGIDTYTTPGDGGFAAPEIWAVGMRNPWRFAFDGDELWIADVGQRRVEEINRVRVDDVGLNFGWNIYEGSECFGAAALCTSEGFVFPIAEYGHDVGCSITGGYVYRGAAIPTLDGHYFFADYCTGILRSIAPDGTEHDWTDTTGVVRGATSFGVDAAGELYVIVADGRVLRLVAS